MPSLIACERTGMKLLLKNGKYVCDTNTGTWLFVSKLASKSTDYIVDVGLLSKTPENLILGLCKLKQQPWFNTDDFMTFIKKLKDRNNVIGHLA